MSPPDVYPVELRSERLLLREVGPADAEAAFRWASDPEFFLYMAHTVVGTVAEERAVLRGFEADARRRPRTQYHLGIVLQASNELVGMVRVGVVSTEHRHGDLGYGVRRDQWGRGITTEAASLLVGFAFEVLGLHRVAAFHDPENIASGRVMQKLGMQPEGTLRENMWAHGRWRDSTAYAVLETDWRAAS